MYLRNLQQVENEGSYRGIRSCRHVVEPDSCSILTHADSSRRAVSFRKDTSEMRALRDDVHAEQLTAYRQVSGCKGKNI